jgi:DNA-binding LacI/PurR family transcriptional regulator
VASGDIPFLVVDRPLEADPWPLEAGPCDFLGFDSRRGTQAAVEYLVAHGHKKIGYLRGLSSTETARERYEAFLGAMARLSLQVPDESVFEGDYRVESGQICANLLIELSTRGNTPTAMVCANDLMAIGLMQRLQEHGWKLPDQLSVVGFDNISWSRWVYPALTTIAQPVEEIVRLGSSLLARRLAEFERDPLSKSPPVYQPFNPQLIERNSVAVPLDRANAPQHRWGIRGRHDKKGEI